MNRRDFIKRIGLASLFSKSTITDDKPKPKLVSFVDDGGFVSIGEQLKGHNKFRCIDSNDVVNGLLIAGRTINIDDCIYEQ